MESSFDNQTCGVLFCPQYDAFVNAKIIMLALFMAIGVPANFIILYVSVRNEILYAAKYYLIDSAVRLSLQPIRSPEKYSQ